MNVAIVLGTARIGNQSKNVAEKLSELVRSAGAEVTFVDVSEHVTAAASLPPWGEGGANETPTEWKTIVHEADALVFVLPEYNHGYPGEWKLLVDSLLKEYSGKTAYVAAVSAGGFAGTRVMEHVIPVLLELGLHMSSARLHVGNVKEVFSDDGEFTDADTKERFTGFANAVAAGVK